MSVSFTDEEKDVMLEKGYEAEESELGYVYFFQEGISIQGTITVKRMEYPWYTCFEVGGMEIVKKK